MNQHTWKFTTKNCLAEVVEGAKGIMQSRIRIRRDPLKLPGDPVKVVAGSLRDLHEILTNGNPGAEAMITELIVRMTVPIATADIIEKKTNMTIARYLHFIKNQKLY